MSYPTPARGQIWQSRDEQYEPGRQVRVDAVSANRVEVTTVANPSRPHTVGNTASLQVLTLQKRWRLVADVAHPVSDEAASASGEGVRAVADVTRALVSLVHAHDGYGDPEDAYEGYLFRVAEAAGIDLHTALLTDNGDRS